MTFNLWGPKVTQGTSGPLKVISSGKPRWETVIFGSETRKVFGLVLRRVNVSVGLIFTTLERDRIRRPEDFLRCEYISV